MGGFIHLLPVDGLSFLLTGLTLGVYVITAPEAKLKCKCSLK